MESFETIFFDDVDANQIEVEVNTTESILVDPVLLEDPNIPTAPRPIVKPKKKWKITELKAIYNCKICGYNTLSKDTMNAHLRTHKKINGTQYEVCKSYNVKPIKYEQCSHCSFFTRQKSHLKSHMRIHMNNTPYKCTNCEFRAKDLVELIKHHEKGHDFDVYVCEYCGYKTYVRERFHAHQHIHKSEKRYKCEVCLYETNEKGNLNRHMKVHCAR